MAKFRYVIALQVFFTALLIAEEATPATVTPPEINTVSSHDRVVWEAEWANRLTGTFEFLPDNDCSGQGAMWAREGSGRQNGGEASYLSNNPLIEMGIADYYFDVPRSGQYQVYMRLWAMDKCGNSCWVSIDSIAASSMRYFPGGKTGRLGSFRHNDWPSGSLETWIWATDETITYSLSKGKHHMRIKVREDGFAIDQIALLPVGSRIPSGRLKCTSIPGSSGLPSGIAFSTTSQTSPSSNTPTPFDLFLTLDDTIASGTPLQTRAYAWVRLNADKPATIKLTFKSPGTPITPVNCTLTPTAPIVVVPVTFILPETATRRNYSVSASAESESWPDLRIERYDIVKHRLDWVISSPVSYNVASQILRELKSRKPNAVSSLPTKVGWSSINWKRPQIGKDYDKFGAIDLGSLHGDYQDRAVVAATWITVQDSKAYSIYGGGDDKLTLYADGQLILSDYRNCPLTDSIKYHPVMMNKGKVLLIAVSYQSQRWWQFHVDFRESSGTPTGAIVGHTWK